MLMGGGGVETTELLMPASRERKLLNLFPINLGLKWQWSLMTTESLIASDRKIDLIIYKTATHFKKAAKDQILFGFCFDFHLL